MLSISKTLGCFIFISASFFSICDDCSAMEKMQQVSPSSGYIPPNGNRSTIVFMRPSSVGFESQASVFELSGEQPKLIGIFSSKSKLSCSVTPGKHLFMVIGESADFMSAEVLPNRAYYVLVTPRMGWFKARFSLKALNRDQNKGTEFDEWLEECHWVKKTSEADNWAQSNMPSIQSKRVEDYVQWMKKPAKARPHIAPQDFK